MNRAGTGHAAQAEATAEAEALIAEARARARRRRRMIAIAVLCVAVLAAGLTAAAGGFSGGRPAAGAGHRAGGAAPAPARPPAYFLDAIQSGGAYDWMEIRDSATGKLVARPPLLDGPQTKDYLPPYGLAATGPGRFVVGMMTTSDCATRFFRLRLDNRGRPGALSPVGPTLPGTLTAMAASAGGGSIGYAIDDSGCHQGGNPRGAYLGVLDVRSGRTHQWTGAPQSLSQLSMSANGRLLAFTRTTSRPMPGGGLEITGLQVLVLPTDAPAGPVAERGRVVARTAATFSASGSATVLLSPTGTSFYLCSEPFTPMRPGARRITESARILAYRTATGKATGVLAAFSASFAPSRGSSGHDPMTLGCDSMALDPSGRFLLVPYQESYRHPNDYYSGASLRAAVISTATGARSAWTLRFGERQAPGSIAIAW